MVFVRVLVLVLVFEACSSPGARSNGRPVVPNTVLDGSGAGSAAKATVDAGAGNYAQGPGGFPIPLDARPIPSSTDDHDYTFEMPRPQDPIVAELKRNLAALGFDIEDEYLAPEGSIHWVITRGAKVYKVSVAGELMRSLLIVTID